MEDMNGGVFFVTKLGAHIKNLGGYPNIMLPRIGETVLIPDENEENSMSSYKVDDVKYCFSQNHILTVPIVLSNPTKIREV